MNIFMQKLDNFFKVTKRGSTIKNEIIGGLTTFLAINYILLVTPLNLQVGGMDPKVVFTTTAISVIITTLIMALYANYPLVLVPGLGMQAFFSYTIVLGMGYNWQTGLFATFVSGVIFLAFSLSGARQKIIHIIPNELKVGMTVGLGFFITLIGLKSAGIIVGNEGTLVTLGDLHNPAVLLSLVGVILILVLMIKNIKSYLFMGMVIMAVIAVIIQFFGIDMGIVFPSEIIAMPASIDSTLFAAFHVDMKGLLLDVNFWVIVMSIFFVDFFDTAGSLWGVQQALGDANKNGENKVDKKIYFVDGIGIIFSSIIGVTSSATAVESIAGIRQGAKTGLSSVVVAIGMLVVMFFSPLLAFFPGAVTAPALVIVGLQMIIYNLEVDKKDIAMGTSMIFMVVMILFSFSVAEGLALGVLLFAILRIAEGKAKELHPAIYGLVAFFIFYFIIK